MRTGQGEEVVEEFDETMRTNSGGAGRSGAAARRCDDKRGMMRTVLMSAVCGLTLLTACGKQNDDGKAAAESAPAATKYAAVDEARLLAANEPSNAGQWMSYGRDYAEQRFSPLKSINRETVKNLGLAWYGDFDT